MLQVDIHHKSSRRSATIPIISIVIAIIFLSLLSLDAKSAERGETLFKKLGLRDVEESHVMRRVEPLPNRQQRRELQRIADYGSSPSPINSRSMGQWDVIDREYSLWRIKLSSKDSTWMDVLFTSMQLPQGTTIVISNPSNGGGWHYSEKDLEGLSRLRSAAVSGNTLLIEVKVPYLLRDDFYIELGDSLLGFDFMAPIDTTLSGSCNVDAVCEVGPASKPDNVRSVAHYTFEVPGEGGYVCSGALLANKGSHIPYFLTAHHCVSTQAEADTMNVYWNYQSPECRVVGSSDNATPLSIGFATHNQYGAQLRATYAPTDFTLVELNDVPASGANTYYAGWTRLSTIDSWPSSGGIYTIHHPQGEEKRVSIVDDGLIERSGYYNDAGDGDTHWRIDDYSIGTTEGGSSGAPLFLNSFIIGQLHGGDAACGNNDPDWYGAFDRSYIGGGTHETQLKWWLQHGQVTGPVPGSSLTTVQAKGYEGP